MINKTVIAICGIPGSGKTTLLKRINSKKELYPVFKIDDYYLKYKKLRNKELQWFEDKVYTDKCYDEFFNDIMDSKSEIVFIESTGLGRSYDELRNIKLIKLLLKADLDLVIPRIQQRNLNSKIKVSDDDLEYFYRALSKIENDFDFVIKATESEDFVYNEVVNVLKGEGIYV